MKTDLQTHTRFWIVPLLAITLLAACKSGASKEAELPPVPAKAAAIEIPAEDVPFVARRYGKIEAVRPDEQKGSNIKLPPVQGVEDAVLTYAPEVPPAIQRHHASRVIVKMDIEEVVKELAEGVTYTFWTFGGETPGPMIRVRQGDLVEFHLMNGPHNKMPHNIDLHAVTGTGGGAEASFVVPGKSAAFEFRAIKPGLYVYHCAMAPVGLHVANGMYGLILVQPEEGLPKVDREYYVMQSEFYTKGGFNEKGLQLFDMNKALHEEPEYVVFNGGVGALSGDHALQAGVGEKVRLYVGNAGPNLTSSFHLIGEMFDAVYTEGGTTANQHNVQTTMIPAGGSAIVDFTVDVPGSYTLVDHSIFRAFNKGAVGTLKVSGPENHALYSGQIKLEDYNPGAGLITQSAD